MFQPSPGSGAGCDSYCALTRSSQTSVSTLTRLWRRVRLPGRAGCRDQSEVSTLTRLWRRVRPRGVLHRSDDSMFHPSPGSGAGCDRVRAAPCQALCRLRPAAPVKAVTRQPQRLRRALLPDIVATTHLDKALPVAMFEAPSLPPPLCLLDRPLLDRAPAQQLVDARKLVGLRRVARGQLPRPGLDVVRHPDRDLGAPD